VLRDLEIRPADYPGGLTRFAALIISVRGLTFPLPTRQYAIRRWEFDDWLLRRAGVAVHQHKVERIVRVGKSYHVDGMFSADYIVGAGGTRCPVYRTLFRDACPRDGGSLIVTLEDEFPYSTIDSHCRLWFVEHGLSGYSWYVPKANGIVNIGIGGQAETLRAAGDHITRHWRLLVNKLDRLGLVRDYAGQPRGYAYYLRQARPKLRRDNALIVGDAAGLATRDMGEGIGPAIRSGLLAAEAILHDRDYSLQSVAKTSLLPSLSKLIAALRPRP
jgi:flavin-dependent dehydrogenase